MVMLSLAALELGTGLGAAVMAEHERGAAIGIFPDRGVQSTARVWHPLLQAANVPTPAGTRLRFHVDSQGLRGRGRLPGELQDRIVVAVFGGSMVENIALSDGETWPERLQALMGVDRFAVLNRAVSSNGTIEYVICTVFYHDMYGARRRATPSITSAVRTSPMRTCATSIRATPTITRRRPTWAFMRSGRLSSS